MPTEQLTISMWVRLRPGSSDEQYFLSYFTLGEASTDGDQINVGLLNNRLYVYWSDGETFSETEYDLRDGNYHHLVLHYQAQQLLLYLDGTVVISLAVSGGLNAGGTITLGQEQDELGGGFDNAQVTEGDIDEVAVFARALSANEITRLRDSYQCALTSCKAHLLEKPLAPSGTYWLSSAGTSPSLAYCDMDFDGGGWTLISSLFANAGNRQIAATVTPGVQAYMPEVQVQALAEESTQMHIRSADLNEGKWIVSKPTLISDNLPGNHPMVNFRTGNVLNLQAGFTPLEYWDGPFATQSGLESSCVNNVADLGYPNLYWACGNPQGLHFVNATRDNMTHSVWQFNTNVNEPMEAYLR